MRPSVLPVWTCIAAALWSAPVGARQSAPTWLVGHWTTNPAGRRVTVETWSAPRKGLMAGSSVTTVAGRPVERETETIDLRRQRATFTAIRDGSAATVFTEAGRTRDSITFENPRHDYPQRIRYRRAGAQLIAEISLLDGGKATRWTYHKVGRRH